MSFSVGISHGWCDTATCPCKNSSLAMTLWSAAEQGFISHIITKIKRDPKVVNKLDNYGYSPLHYAAQQNHHSIVDFLLRNGAMPDLQGCGATPLHRAAFSGSLESCRLLVDAGADVNAQDYSFGDLNTPCHKAALAKRSAVVDFLLHCSSFDNSIVNSNNQTVFDVLKLIDSEEQQPMNQLHETVTIPDPKIPVDDTELSEIPTCDKCHNPSLSFAKGPNGMLLCLNCRYGT